MDDWKKPRAELTNRFTEIANSIEGLRIRQMFGMPTGFVGGNMAAGLHQDTFIVRLPEEARQERLAAGWSRFEPMPGRPLREYLALPPDVAADPAAVRVWFEIAVAYVLTLPAKEPRKRTSRAKA